MIGEKFFDENNFAGEKIIPIFATALKRKRHTKIYCGVEQLVARWAHNPKVVSSSLTPATYSACHLCVGRFFLLKKL